MPVKSVSVDRRAKCANTVFVCKFAHNELLSLASDPGSFFGTGKPVANVPDHILPERSVMHAGYEAFITHSPDLGARKKPP